MSELDGFGFGLGHEGKVVIVPQAISRIDAVVTALNLLS